MVSWNYHNYSANKTSVGGKDPIKDERYFLSVFTWYLLKKISNISISA